MNYAWVAWVFFAWATVIVVRIGVDEFWPRDRFVNLPCGARFLLVLGAYGLAATLYYFWFQWGILGR